MLPVVEALAPALPGRISVDTYKARVAAKALEAGAYMINDISALRMDPEMVAVVRDAGCPVILMHMLGEPKTMQVAPALRRRRGGGLRLLRGAARLGGGERAQGGEPAHRPGPGLRQDDRAQPGDPARPARRSGRWAGRWWWGPRANGSWGRYSASTRPSERDEATAATTVLAVCAGAHIVRVHRVAVNRDAVARVRPAEADTLGPAGTEHRQRRERGLRWTSSSKGSKSTAITASPTRRRCWASACSTTCG